MGTRITVRGWGKIIQLHSTVCFVALSWSLDLLLSTSYTQWNTSQRHQYDNGFQNPLLDEDTQGGYGATSLAIY